MSSGHEHNGVFIGDIPPMKCKKCGSIGDWEFRTQVINDVAQPTKLCCSKCKEPTS